MFKPLLILLLAFMPVTLMSQVTAAFSASISSGCPPLVVSFTDQSTTSSGTITSWAWDFDNTNTSALQNPSAGFVTPGSYVVTLTVTNSGGQSASATHTITVYNKPTVSFTSSPSSGCSPLAVQFSSSGSSAGSGTIQSYQWDFGDGSSFSAAQNPSHTYNAGGTFIPSLKITNSHGCHTTSAGSQITASAGPTASFTSSNPQGCAPPHTVNFNNTSTGSSLTYNWDLDIATSTATNPSQTYTAVGEYDIRLIATDGAGCKDTSFVANFVKVSDVVPNFSVVTPSCVDEPITITNSSTGAIAYTWAWGDGTTGSGSSPYKAYTAGGTYTITLTAINGICSATSTKTIAIQQITPSFTSSASYACEVPNTTYYTNTSTVNFGSIVYHEWRWGIYDPILGTPYVTWSEIDTVGADSCVRDPDDLGYFDDTLIVVSDIGCTAQVVHPQSIFIEVMQAAYNAQPPRGCVPASVDFTDISVPTTWYPIVSWQWDFDNGQTASTQNASGIVYTDTGCYGPKLIITNGFGCKDSIFPTGSSDSICYGFLPTAEASFEVGSICPDDTSWFYNVPNDTFTNEYLWNFSAGNSTTGDTVPVFFPDTGWINLQYIVGHHGCYDTVYYDSVMYVNGPIVTFSTYLNCDSSEYRKFTALTWKGVQRFYWDFGDGTPFDSVNMSPVHYYDSTGSYVPKLLVFNDSAGCEATLATQVFINHLVSKFTSNNFGANPIDSVACLPALFEFDADSSEGEFGSYQWIYDGIDTGLYTIKDQYFFTSPGFHEVALTVHDLNNCQRTSTKEIFISGPLAYFDYEYSGNCDPVEIEFEDLSQIDTNLVSWNWNFGDSSALSSLQNPNHEFTSEGTYMVRLSIEDTFGCTSNITRPVLIKLPVVAYSVDTIACENEYSYFQNLSFGDSLTYFWYFDNGSTSSLQSPNPIFYVSPGLKHTFLAIQDAVGCKDTAFVTVDVKPDPVAGFTSDTAESPCLPLVVTFTDESNADDLASWRWNFGDGSVSSLLDTGLAYHTYTLPGQYDVKLTVWSEFGCSDDITKTKYIKVDGPYAEFSVAPDSACVGDPVEFSITLNDKVGSYTWVYGDGYDTTVVGSVKKVYHAFNYVGIRTPIAVYHDSSGICRIPFLDSVYIHEVKALYSFFPDSVGCGRLNTKVNSTSLGADRIRWDLGQGKYSESSNNSLYFPETGEYEIELYVVNEEIGCEDSITKLFVVKPMPDVKAYGDTLICLGDSTRIYAESDVQPITWLWDDSTFSVSPRNDSTIVHPSKTIYMIAQAFDTNGCVGSDSVRIIVQDTPEVHLFSDTTVVIGELVVIVPETDDELFYEWNPPNLLSCSDCQYPTYLASEANSFILTVRDVYGCFEKDFEFSISIEEKYSLDVPEAFSPDGDGINDVIYARGWGIKELLEFRIYNRWGEEVFSTNSLHVGWDGTYRGKSQGMDTYAFIVKGLKYSGEEIQKEGFIQLVR